MEKRFANYWPSDSAEYVVMHGAWQRARGRNPSTPYMDIRNPRLALELAAADLALTDTAPDTLTKEVQQEDSHRGSDKILYRAQTLYRTAERARTIASVQRSQQVQAKVKQGMTQRAISEVMGVSPTRIKQLAGTGDSQSEK